MRAGCAVVQADVRGMHDSEGAVTVLSDQDARDYDELIAWAADQAWSTGAVGLPGVSYLPCRSGAWLRSSRPRCGPSAPGKG